MSMNLKTKTAKRTQSDFDAYPTGYGQWISDLSDMGITVSRQGNVCFLNGNGYVNEGVSELSQDYCY